MQKLFICKTIRNLEGNTNYGDSEIEENIGNFAKKSNEAGWERRYNCIL